MKINFCPNCGSKQQGNAFCSKCGNKLSVEKEKVNLTTSKNILTKNYSVSPKTNETDKPKKTKKKNKSIYIIIFLSLIVYGCLYFYDDGYYLGKKTYIDYIDNALDDAGVVGLGGLGMCSLNYFEISINNNIQGIFKIDIDELSSGIELIPKKKKYGLTAMESSYIQIAYLLRIRYLTEINEFELALDDYDTLIEYVDSNRFNFSCYTIYQMDRILLENKYSLENNLKIDDERLCYDFVNSFKYDEEFRNEDGDIYRFIFGGESELQWKVWASKYETNILFEKIMENCNLTIKKMDDGTLMMRDKMYWE